MGQRCIVNWLPPKLCITGYHPINFCKEVKNTDIGRPVGSTMSVAFENFCELLENSGD
jgi:hypothetical protein